MLALFSLFILIYYCCITKILQINFKLYPYLNLVIVICYLLFLRIFFELEVSVCEGSFIGNTIIVDGENTYIYTGPRKAVEKETNNIMANETAREELKKLGPSLTIVPFDFGLKAKTDVFDPIKGEQFLNYIDSLMENPNYSKFGLRRVVLAALPDKELCSLYVRNSLDMVYTDHTNQQFLEALMLDYIREPTYRKLSVITIYYQFTHLCSINSNLLFTEIINGVQNLNPVINMRDTKTVLKIIRIVKITATDTYIRESVWMEQNSKFLLSSFLKY